MLKTGIEFNKFGFDNLSDSDVLALYEEFIKMAHESRAYCNAE